MRREKYLPWCFSVLCLLVLAGSVLAQVGQDGTRPTHRIGVLTDGFEFDDDFDDGADSWMEAESISNPGFWLAAITMAIVLVFVTPSPPAIARKKPG